MSNYDEKSNLSFGFSKINKKINLKDSILNESVPAVDDSTKYVTIIDKNEKIEEKKFDLIIPLIKKNRWLLKPNDIDNDVVIFKKVANTNNLIKSYDKTGDILVDTAIDEILKDAANFNELKTENYLDLKIPILLQNKVPDNYETDERLNVKLRPDSNIEDYNDVPIESFGMAMLRGMGWNEKEKSIKIKEVKVRPKGLGLAADKSVVKQLEETSDQIDKKEKLRFKKGTHCLVNNGRFNGKYGTIMGIDEDNSRVVLSLSLCDEMITVSRYSIQLITKKEYERGYRCLNQSKVDEYKKLNEPSMVIPDPSLFAGIPENEKFQKHKSREPHVNGHFKKMRPNDNCNMLSQDDNSQLSSWLHNSLRVRFIDKKYMAGKFYKSKLIIEDLISRNICICKTEDGKIIEDIRCEQLETVIPKDIASFVMVLSGKYKFKLGELLERYSADSIALVQLLIDRDIVLKLHFDDICEYVGNIDTNLDY